MADKPTRYYAMDDGNPRSEPNYERVVRSLSEEDLEAEILAKKGDPGYQLALIVEHDRRANLLREDL